MHCSGPCYLLELSLHPEPICRSFEISCTRSCDKTSYREKIRLHIAIAIGKFLIKRNICLSEFLERSVHFSQQVKLFKIAVRTGNNIPHLICPAYGRTGKFERCTWIIQSLSDKTNYAWMLTWWPVHVSTKECSRLSKISLCELWWRISLNWKQRSLVYLLVYSGCNFKIIVWKSNYIRFNIITHPYFNTVRIWMNIISHTKMDAITYPYLCFYMLVMGDSGITCYHTNHCHGGNWYFLLTSRTGISTLTWLVER